MTLVRCHKISKFFADKTILIDVTLEINARERIGLVGLNGAGKTTLANIIAGNLSPDGGKVICYKSKLRIGYLRQSPETLPRSLEGLLDPDPNHIRSFLETASQMGLEKVSQWQKNRFQGLSGGEITKLALAQVWATHPDILILDEPTNHMDFQGVEWLVAQINKFDGAALIISHDRWFLDQVVTRIYELEGGKATEYPGNYSYYREEKQRRFESQMHHYLAERKEQRKIQDQINRLKNWSDKAHRESTQKEGYKEYWRVKAKKKDQQIKSRIKMLQKMQKEGTARPEEEKKPEFNLSSRNRGRRIIEAQNLAKGYQERLLFKDSYFYVQRGEKIGIIGPNGCGKTTLLRLLLGKEQPDTGTLWISPTLHPGYLSQDVTDMETEKNTLEILGITDKARLTQARTMLANMGLDADMVAKPVGQLSLGERTRVKLAQMILEERDLLILDEPTNHLDLHSREKLEQNLVDYQGTLLIVSHDRYLLERVCDKLLLFTDQTIKKLEYGFARYMAEREGKQKNTQSREEKLLTETRIAFILGKLNTLTPEDPEYAQLDQEFKELIKRRR